MPPSSSSALSVRGWSAAAGTNQSKIIDLMLSTVAALLAVLAAVLLLVGGPRPLALTGASLTVVGLLLVGWLLRREAGRLAPVLSTYVGARVVLAVAVGAGYLLRRPDSAVAIWAATGMIMAGVLVEATIKVLLGKTSQVAVNLPGVRPVPAPPYAPDRLTVGSLLVLVVGGLLAAFGLPAWTYVVVAAAGTAAVMIMIGYAARANVAARTALARLPKALAKHQPAFAVYYGGSHGARYQLGMWLPYLERVGRPFVVITREPETVPTITALTSAPVIVPRTTSALGDLEQLVPRSMKAAFYVQGSRANLSFQKFRQLTHVWLNHGDSDKAANFSARHATYDKVLVCGQQGVDRYAAHGVIIPPQRMIMVGRPQVERIQVRDQVLPASAPRTILYAPTWRGGRPATDYSSLGLGERIVDALLARGVTVIFRPHPLSYGDPADAGLIRRLHQRLDDDRRRTGRAHVWGRQAERDWEIADCLNAADGLITDVSSVASDNLASGKPFAMVAMRSAGEAFRREFPMARVAYVIEKDLSTLDQALDDLLGTDPLAEQRRAYRSYCLGDQLGEHAADEFLRVAGEIVTGRVEPRKTTSPEPPLEDVLFGGDPDVAELVEAEEARITRITEQSGEVA